MRNPRWRVLRVFAVLAVVASMVGSFATSATAAPGSVAAPERGAYQAELISVQLCTDLYLLGVLDVGGVATGSPEDVEAALIELGLDLSVELLGGLVGLIVNTDACAGLVNPPATAASMTGQVLSSLGDPIVGATVTVNETGQSTTSVDGGYYAIGGVPNGDYTVTASASGFESQTVNASIIDGTNGAASFALVPVGASVAGQVFDSNGAPIVGATVCVDGTDLCATSVDGGYYAIGGVPNGDYTVTASAYGYESQTVTASIVGGVNAGADFTLTPVGASVAGQVFDADGNPIVGATVVVNETGQTTTSVDGGYYAIGGVVNGTYTVTASADGFDAVTLDATVAGATVTLDFTLPTAAPPVATTGFVEVYKAYCADVDGVVFNGDDLDDDCVPGPATFTFYLVGDGTAEYWQLDVWEDGFGSIELAAGTYEVVEEGTQATTTIEVVAGETTVLTVANPGEAPAPRNGTVNLSVFTCNNIDEVIFTSDGFAVLALPTFEPACEPGAATLTFYLVGDGTADYTQIDVNGTGSIELAPGTYEVVEEGTQASTFITVFAGDFITLDVQIPAGGEVVPGSSVNIVKFYCDTVTEVEWLSISASEYSERDELAGAPDCVSGAATFTFYLVGDGTDDHAQIHVNGSGTIGLEPGTYEVVEEETQARFDLEVLDGENTVLIVNNPMPEDGEVPVVPDDGDDNGDADADGTDDGKKGDDSKVTGLPSTGSGVANGTGLLTVAAAAAAAISGAGALAIRKER